MDAYAAVRRFLPAWRDHTALARMYLRNWSRTLTIRGALPLPVDIIMGMIGVAAVQDKWALCGAMYIGYLGLLRTGELFLLRVSQVTDYADTGCVVLSRFTSLDLTTSYGRWAFAGTARRYISQAMSDLESVKQPQEGRDRAARFARIFPVLLRVQG